MGAAERCVVAVGEGGGPPMKGKFSASNPESLTREIAALAGACTGRSAAYRNLPS